MCIILVFVYGINSAFVAMCGMKIVVIGIDVKGNINVVEFKVVVEKYFVNLVVFMVMYLLMYGVYEEDIKEICEVIY